MHYLFEPGLFSSGPVRTALLVGAIVAVTSGVIGVFTVLRGQSFAGHSLADIATTGGSGAFLVGVNQFWGFLVAGVAAATVMEAIGVQRRRGRDVATGVVLGGALGLAALFLYLGTLRTATTGASFTVLFGSIFVINPDTVPVLIASGAVALLVVAVLARVLLLTSVSPDLARARGVNVRLVGILYLAALAISVSLASVAIGAVLSTALLIGPSATALRLTKSPARAMAASALVGLVATWVGIVLAYDSYHWPPHGHTWPVSFFVVVGVLACYLLSYLRPRRRQVPRSPHAEEAECGPRLGEGAIAKIASVPRPYPADISRGDDPPPVSAGLRARWQKSPSYRARKPALSRGDDPPYPPMSALARGRSPGPSQGSVGEPHV